MLGESLRRRRASWAARPRGGAPRDWRRWVLVGTAVVAMGFGIGYACAVAILFPPPETVEQFTMVPDLRRLTLESATEHLAADQLALEGVDSLTHPSVPAGEIIAQGPLPGQLTVPGGSVRVTVSRGPEMRTVPDVRNMRRGDAETILTASGFSIRIDTVHADVEPGRIVGIEPEPGRAAPLPSEVRVTVSTGPALRELPSLLGRLLDEARSTLDSLGLVVSEIERRPGFEAPPGTVIGQEPAAGTLLDPGSAVRLVVVGDPPQ